ncbi:ATP-binding cassette domain-containing protein [Nocardia stercoris]|uniref:ABC transporter ATP-binding protein n=1 Tax=Nocardia stercoris TaxID=2483361 RepID=A0A3M2LCF3_9NOCA|nr:ABC transporter ATP-binding protein [Nocardia stercoris]RMI35064.1 ABC transporter ATP-binding protein [Nocardia stercoris]
MTGAACSVSGLHRAFGGVTVLRDVSFRVPVGGIAAVVGPPDSGKTTLVRILLGLLPPSSGTVTVGGRAPGGRGATPVGAMLQSRGLHPARTARGELRRYAAAAGAGDERVDQLLARLGLAEVADIRIRELAESQRTRLALAVAVIGDPPLLVLDDPLAGLDPADQVGLLDVVRGHARRGGTVVLTAQSLAPVVPVADGLIVLSGGSVVFQGSPRRLRRDHPDRLVVASSSPIALATALAAEGFTDTVMRPDGRLGVAEATPEQVQAAARVARVHVSPPALETIHPDRVLAELTARGQSAPAQPPAYPVPARPVGYPPPPGPVPQPPTSYGMPR